MWCPVMLRARKQHTSSYRLCSYYPDTGQVWAKEHPLYSATSVHVQLQICIRLVAVASGIAILAAGALRLYLTHVATWHFLDTLFEQAGNCKRARPSLHLVWIA